MGDYSQPIVSDACNDDHHATHLYDPIAIIGMGMRLPGRIHNATEYWDLLVNGKSGRCRVPKSRYNIDTWYDPVRTSHVPSEYGYFLEELNLAHMDPNFWSFTKQEAELMDPQQRLFLEVAYEALENSGSTTWRGNEVGVYVGTMGEAWNQLESQDRQSVQDIRPDVYGDYIIANRASYEFDLTGPSVVVRTACSASLVALHQACRDLHNGGCSSALVGGVNLILSPKDTVTMRKNGVLSPSATCKSFDADADGFARGESVTAIYIKRLSDAVRDGDPIRAVIRSTCIAGNGRTPGLTTPNPKIHERLMRKGHELAGITDLSKTAMIECHGTGTPVGDPLEVNAVANIWGDHGIYIGSVKPNIGHGEGASGLSSVIKMVLALENSTIPPNIHFKTPNPRIPWDSAKLQVPIEPLPWPTNKLERVSVNSFGIGGSNAHVLLESVAASGLPPSKSRNRSKDVTLGHRLLAFSAQHPDSVQTLIRRTEDYLTYSPVSLNDVAYSLASRREVHSYRAFCVTDDKASLQKSPAIKTRTTPPDIIWVFTGQGAQWAQMGKELLEQEPLFKQRIDALDGILGGLSDPPSWTLTGLLSAPQEESLLDQAEFSQPCLIAIQVGLVELLQSWGVHPSAVVGHSSGETAAAFATGAITAEEAILIAYHRGQITRLIKAAHNGGMAAVGLGRKRVESFLRPGVIVGCENSPENVTLSGDSDVLRSILLDISSQHPGVLSRSLRVECGYHSHHMQAAAADFTSRLEGLQLQNKEPLIPFYSSVTGERNTDMSPAYWVRNAVSPVLFNNVIQTALDDFKSPVFVEIGPHSALAGPIRQILQLKNSTAQYIPTLIRNQHAVSSTLNTAGKLWLAGARVDIAAVNPPGDYLTNLPTYPWQYDEEYWVESRLSRSWRHRKFKTHELLGSRVEEIGDACPAWRCVLRREDIPWLRDHVVRDETVFPASGFICMVVEALKQLKGSVDFSLGRISILAALVLDDQPVELVTILNLAHSNTTSEIPWYDFSVSSLNEGSEVWVKHISGQCRAGSTHKRLAPELSPLPRNVSVKSFYNTWKRFGLDYGNTFRGLASATSHVTETKAAATLEDRSTICGNSDYTIHPATLDTSMHVTIIAACHGLERNFCRLEVPTYIHEVYIGKPTGQVQVAATVEAKGHSTAKSNVVGVSNGQVVIDISGLQVSAFGACPENEEDDPHAGAVLTWMPDIDFETATHLLSPRKATDNLTMLDELALACIVDLRAQAPSVSSTQPHLASFKTWLEVSYEDAMEGKYHNVPNSFEIATMSKESRGELIGNLMEASMRTAASDLAQAVFRAHNHCTDSLLGHPDAVEKLTRPSHFAGLPSLLQDVEYSEFLRLLGHKRPNMSILHINPTPEMDDVSSVLFCQEEGHRPYGSYVCTNISAKPSELIEKRLSSIPGASYRQLMMEMDPIPQGFTENSFDLIIFEPTPFLASNAVFTNLRRLLTPQGRIVFQQMNPASKVLHLAYGLSPNFYPPRDDQTLRDHLARAGFDESSIASHTGKFGRLTIAMPCIKLSKPQTASILCQDAGHPLVADATRYLQSKGTSLQFFSPGQELPWGIPVICLLDLESPFFHGLAQPQWGELKKSFLSAQDEKWLWITAASQIECKDPRYALTLGVTRSIRRELVMDLVTLELDHFEAKGWNAMNTLFESLENRASGGDTQADTEYAFHNNFIQICRFHHVKVADELRQKCDSAPKHLRISKPGRLQTLHWEEAKFDTLGGDDLQVEVKAAGLNTKDLHVLLGNSSSCNDYNNCSSDFGLEGSGIVTAVGPKARRIRVGDRVAFNHGGSLSTSIILSETLCAETPETMSFEEAASIPYSYGTVLYGLMEIGRLKKGQSVLIHSDCDALGLAAVQVASLIGAEIFCTYKSSEQLDYLTTTYGIARDHIIHDANSCLTQEVLQRTRSCGVDIVFSTLPGLFREAWGCVASFGTMVQVHQDHNRAADLLQMDQSSRSRTLVGVNLEELRRNKPWECTRLLEQAFMLHKFGLNQPPQPIRSFKASDVISSFKYLQSNERIGRVIITMPQNCKEIEARPLPSQIALRSDRTYIIVGGLGGLGQATARFLVEKGARHLIFFSRSAEEFAKCHPEYFKELHFLGCEVQAISGSVSELPDVMRMVETAHTLIAGVLHAAMVLQDAHFADMSFDQWQTAVSPKVQGTWNLHHALRTQSEPLDFLFLFSSLSGLGGHIGQVNYAAANAFLDAFVQYRHSQGLACSTLDIGIMEDIGVLSRDTNRLDALRATSQHCLHEQDLLDALELMIQRSFPDEKDQDLQPAGTIRGYTNQSQLAIGMRYSSSANRTGWQQEPRAGFLTKSAAANQPIDQLKSGSTLKQYLQSCVLDPEKAETDEAKEFLAKEIGSALSGFMMRQDEEVDLSLPLQTDSLVTVELRNWIRRKMGVVLKNHEMLMAESILALGGLVGLRLSAKYKAGTQDLSV